jgi:hypothetical protein
MKFFLYILTTLVLLAMSGCFKEESEILQPYQEGAVMGEVEAFSTVFIIDDLQNSFAKFLVTSDTIVKEVTITVNHKRTNTRGILHSYNEIPEDTLEFSVSEIVDAFDGISLSDLDIGDQIIFYIEFTSKNGVKSSSAQSSFLSIVACPTELSGNYTVLASGKSTDPGPGEDENPISNYEYEVQLTKVGGNVYKISDFSGGLFTLWYDIYGLSGDYPGFISDLCGSLSYVNTTGPFGSPIAGSGKVNEETGVIELNGEATSWGDTWTLILSPSTE